MLYRLKPPSFFPIQDFKLIKSKSVELDNQAKVHVVNAGRQSVLNIQIYFKAGRWHENIKGTSFLTAKMIPEGSLLHSSRQISQKFDELGAFLEISSGYDLVGVEVFCLNHHLEKLLPLINELITTATFPENEFKGLKERFIQQLSINLQKNNYLASAKLKETIFGETHPYGYPTNTEMVERIQLSDVKSYFDEKMNGCPFEIFLSGQVDEVHLKQINKELGKIPVIKPLGTPKLPEESEVDEFNYYEEKPDAVQTSIRLGKRIISKKHPDALKFEVMNEILGGYFGSRLMKNIREEKGLTYGIHSNMVFLHNASYFVIGTDVKKDKKDIALEEINKEIKILCDQSVSEEELNLVKNYLSGSHIKLINTPFSIAELNKTLYYSKLSGDYYDNYIKNINEVTAQDIMEMANKYLKSDLYEILVG
ncbi:MAG: insulinase family protein [Flammeovirgaceae bacterium]|nr:insulinase family protein [Flammeovirgaceae bacterium]